jgi:uncharacterized protein (DUF58 family)
MVHIIIVLVLFTVLYKLQEYIYKRTWDRDLTIDIQFGSRDTFEGHTVAFREHVWNGKRIPVPYVGVMYKQSNHLRQTDLSGKETYYGTERSSLFAVRGMRHVTRNTLLECKKRGYYTISKAALQTTDLFFSKTYIKEVPLNANLTVFPREIEVSDIEIPYKRLLGEILTKRFILPDPFEFSGIREYQPFDSFRQINFGAWAKTGSPMSNIYGYTVSQEVRIVLNLQKYSPFYRVGLYENTIKLAAFLARKFIGEGIPTSFVTNGIDCVTNAPSRAEKAGTMRHLQEIYEILARIDLDKYWLSEHIARFLPGRGELGTGGVVVVLISSFADDELYEWNKAAGEAGSTTLWIAPRTGTDALVYRDEVVVWEASNE